MSNQTFSKSPFAWWKPVLFFSVLAVGLYFVKWQPYYLKTFTALETQSIGKSLLADQFTSPWQAMWQYAQVYFLAIWKAALLGVVLGSLMSVLLPKDWFIRYLSQTKFGSILLGTAISFPGMMCTCCAAPVAVGMRKNHASIGATVAFWIANPLLNPATLIFMAIVLGLEFSLLRLAVGAVMVLSIAYLVQRDRTNLDVAQIEAKTAFLKQTQAVGNGNFFANWWRALWALLLSSVPVYLFTVLVLSLARVWLFPHSEGAIGDSFGWVLFLALVGMLFVIPTAAEIPIVQTLMGFGMGISPAFALLMTLPTVSLPSLLMMKSVLSTRSLLIIATAVSGFGVLTALLAKLIF